MYTTRSSLDIDAIAYIEVSRYSFSSGVQNAELCKVLCRKFAEQCGNCIMLKVVGC